ncbi:MAG: mechanosensitive ion channel, partial [Nitrospira sp.]|nr:mechanosensitive ion channel [Nitrospira sp.]
MADSYVTGVIERWVEWSTTSGLRVMIISVLMVVGFAILKRVIIRFQKVYEGTLPTEAQIKRATTLTHVIRDVARVVMLAVGGMMILSEVGVDLKPILAAAGLGGLAVGFGARSLVKDVISGFFILLEDSIRVG